MGSCTAYRIVTRLRVRMPNGQMTNVTVSGTQDIVLGDPVEVNIPYQSISTRGTIMEILEVSIRNLH